MNGRVEFLTIGAQAGGSMQACDNVLALAGKGLVGDRYAEGTGFFSDTPGGGRALTLIEAEALDGLRKDHGIELAPTGHRRNVTTRGIDLNTLVGKQFSVGEVLCEGVRLCEPCEHLVELSGTQVLPALVHRAGLRADVLTGGVIRVGDSVTEAPIGTASSAASPGGPSASGR